MQAARPANHILAALADGERLPWVMQLERVDLLVHQVLQSPGAEASHLHFPISALVALMQPAPGGSEVPVALIGNDGVVGVESLLGVPPDGGRAVVIHAGAAWRLSTQAVGDGGPLTDQLIRAALEYLVLLTAQMAQTAFCQQHHSVEQRLCRWLLTAFDRVPGEMLDITLDDLSRLLNVQIDALAGAAAPLITFGAVTCEPDRLVLHDRAGLLQRVCACHGSASSRGM